MFQTKGILDYKNKFMGNPCDKYISDAYFLKHMIPHHQVAVDMSRILLKYSRNPNTMYLARNILYKQQDEILFMENVLMSSTPNLSAKDKERRFVRQTSLNYYYPDLSSDKKAKCGLHHFSPAHLHVKPDKILTDKAYLKHMIPHHQVAVDMSKRLLKHSTNPLLISFAYDIIAGQEHEIWSMKLNLDRSQNQCSPYFK